MINRKLDGIIANHYQTYTKALPLMLCSCNAPPLPTLLHTVLICMD